MRKLLNYSIETDHLIWLEFNDGQNLRVAPGQIGDHLAGADLVKVKRALKLRRDFIRQNFPKTLILVAAVGLSAFAVADSKDIAHYFRGYHSVPTVPSPAANPAVILTTPTPTEAPPATEAPAASAAPAQNPAPTPPTAVPAVPKAIAPVLQTAPTPAVGPLMRVLDKLTNKLL